MFPFTITQERALGKIANVDSTILIEEIKKELIRLEIDTIECMGEEVQFKNIFFSGRGRNHLMNGVGKGYFKIDKRSGRIIYSYSIVRMLCSMAAVSIIMGFTSQSFSFALSGFLWILGFGFTVSFIRHYFFMNKVKKMLMKLENV